MDAEKKAFKHNLVIKKALVEMLYRSTYLLVIFLFLKYAPNYMDLFTLEDLYKSNLLYVAQSYPTYIMFVLVCVIFAIYLIFGIIIRFLKIVWLSPILFFLKIFFIRKKNNGKI